MTNVRRVIPAAAAALLLAVGAGCAADERKPNPVPDRTPSPASPPSSTSSAAASSPSDIAAESAAEIVRRYYAVRDHLRQDPASSLRQLDAVATSTELTAQRTLFRDERKRGLSQTGDTVISDLQIQAVNLDNSDPEAGKAPTVQVDVCWDVSDVDILDPRGQSIVSPGRPDSGWIRYSVVNYSWGSDPADGWRVATSQDLERASCAGS